MYSLSFLRNWSMQSYSATITCSIAASLAPNGLLTPKGKNFVIKCIQNAELQTHFSQDLLLIDCDIFPQVMVMLVPY